MKKILYISTLLLVLVPIYSNADVIYLKDGTKIETAKAWEEGGFIRFYLQDYEDIIITYSKEIVDRIDRGQIESEKPQSGKGSQAAAPEKKLAPDQGRQPVVKDKPLETVSELSKQNKTVETIPSRQSADTVKTQDSSIQQAPAEKVPKSVETGQTSMEVKPQVKTAKQSSPAAVAAEVTASQNLDGILFYNPRRPHKYWAGADSKYNTYKEAIDALAQKFDRTPQWVEKHLGDTNDLGEIYRNLAQVEVHTRPQTQTRVLTKSLHFYDPRRPYKFWTSETTKHRTLEDALAALARQYDRSPEWIKTHLGETNDLVEIHQNLKKSKAKEKGP